MPLNNWSTTPLSNSSAPPYGAPEFMTLANVNNVMRQIMADTRQLAATSTIASAATCDIGANDATFLTVTGTTGITSLGSTGTAGLYKWLVFEGSLTIAHNATSLILPGAENITTAAGDTALVLCESTGNWRCVSYMRNMDSDTVSVKDFGAVGDGVADDSAEVQAAVDAAYLVRAPAGTYAVANIQLSSESLTGDGNAGTTLLANSTTEVLRLGWTTPNWSYRSIEGLTINGNAKASDGVSFEDATDTEISGRWELRNVLVTACAKGIHKPTGNIGNAFYNVNLTGNDYGYYAVGQASPVMHAGCDLFIGGEISSNALAGIYIDSDISGTGGTRLINTVIESNPGFGIFVKNWQTAYTPLVLDGVWFEDNATSVSVTINGTPYTPHDIYLEDARNVVLQNGIVPDIQLVNSNLTIENCFLDTASTYSIDATSTCTANNVNIDGGAHPIEIHKVATCWRALGNFAARFRGRPRSPQVESALGTVLQSITYSTDDTYSFPGTPGTSTATTVADGVIFDSCAELTLAAGDEQTQTSVTFTNTRWYMASLDVKVTSGSLSDLRVYVIDGGSAFNRLDEVMKSSGWTTVISMGEAQSTFTAGLNLQNTGASPITLRLSALQIMEFTSEKDMLEYYNSGAYSAGTSIPSEFFSTVAPTTGTWQVGDHCKNISPAVGQPKGWYCTVAGTPGTWVSEGNL